MAACVAFPYWSSVWVVFAVSGLLPPGSVTAIFVAMYGFPAGSCVHVYVSSVYTVPLGLAFCTNSDVRPFCHARPPLRKFQVLAPPPLASVSVMPVCAVTEFGPSGRVSVYVQGVTA